MAWKACSTLARILDLECPIALAVVVPLQGRCRLTVVASKAKQSRCTAISTWIPACAGMTGK